MMVIMFFSVIFLYIVSGILVVDGKKIRPNKKTEDDILEVETFFREKGYNIDIIGAHTNGREHEGPFSYGWVWYSFEISEEVIMLYHYNNMEAIEGYLAELEDDIREKCYISEHFLFYYGGKVDDIKNIIMEFCELQSSDLSFNIGAHFFNTENYI